MGLQHSAFAGAGRGVDPGTYAWRSDDVSADAVVIGAGPAGVTVALELRGGTAGRAAALRGRRETAADRDLHRADSVSGRGGTSPSRTTAAGGRRRQRRLGWPVRAPGPDRLRGGAPGARRWPRPTTTTGPGAAACDILDIGRAEFDRPPAGDSRSGRRSGPTTRSRMVSSGGAHPSGSRGCSPGTRTCASAARSCWTRTPTRLERPRTVPSPGCGPQATGSSGSPRGTTSCRGGLENPRLLLHSGIGDSLRLSAATT